MTRYLYIRDVSIIRMTITSIFDSELSALEMIFDDDAISFSVKIDVQRFSYIQNTIFEIWIFTS